MQILNKTRNQILAKEVIVADTAYARIKGLLGRRELEKGIAMVIKPCNSVHTFFMHFPIDVIFVDRNDRVIKIIPFLKPWRLTNIYFSSSFVVELPVGAIQQTGTLPQDTIIIE